MKISPVRIQNLLGKHVYAAIKAIGSAAERSGHPCYLVGGFVRDLILKCPNLDIDLVSDGKITWIGEIAKNRSVKKIIRSQFSTVKLVFLKGFSIDIATARKETYPKTAHLPVVEPGTLREDVMRRDFTINTLLMSISDDDFGTILDLCEGMPDITRGIIRILHDRSFRDDPTRIFRAIRFKHRFAFRLHPASEKSMKQAIQRGYIKKLSPQRLRRELFLILDEDQWDASLKELNKRGIITQIGLPLMQGYRAITQLKAALQRCRIPVQSQNLSKLLALTDHATKGAINRLSEKAGLRKSELNLLQMVHGKKKSILKQLSRSDIPNSTIYKLLEGIPNEGLLYLFSASSSRARKRITRYHTALKNKKSRITGDDLRRIGIAQGPQYTRILREILLLKLDGKLKTKVDELRFAQQLIKGKS